MPFQNLMYQYPAPAIEGDWCSANAKFSANALEGQHIAGPNGVVVGRFAWADADGVVNVGGNGRLVFVHRDQPALIVPAGFANWLPASTMTVPPGLEVTVFDSCYVWARFAAGAQINQTVYANYADGTAFAAAAASPSGATSTTFSITAGTSSVTATVFNGLMTVTVVGSGVVYPGTIIAGTGIQTGTQVQSQLLPLLTGEALGGVGRYLLSVNDAIILTSETITGTYGLMTLGGTVTGTFALGDTLSATGSATNTTITANSTNGASLTGVAGAGTYVVSPTQAISTGTITAATNVATPWFVDSFAEAGELAQISQRG